MTLNGTSKVQNMIKELTQNINNISYNEGSVLIPTLDSSPWVRRN